MKKRLTLCIPYDKNRVLLGMKKRGFGVGRWNGFGGKVSSEETIEEGALREFEEEAGLVAVDYVKVGILDFSFESISEALEVHIYKVSSFTGNPQETEEMKPSWFGIDEIPFEQMWSDDKFWFPYFLSKKLFRGKFHFDKPADAEHSAKILSSELGEVEALE